MNIFRNLSSFYRQYIRPGLFVLALTPAFMMASGCQSSGSSSSSSTQTGEAVVSLTDAQGDFLTYKVDVVSLELHRQDGAVVEALPKTTTVDFAQYVDVSEFLTAATIPPGVYTSATVTLDYSNALITVQDANGNAIPATAVDDNGQPLTTATVNIDLNGGSDFTIAPGIPANITLDFDLEASNEINISGSQATVTVNPVLIADTQLNNPKPHRLRGLLGDVNTTDGSFNVVLRPFLNQAKAALGSLTAVTSATTTYEINGVAYTGSAGLTAISSLAKDTAVVALGTLDLANHQYNATSVLAGSSVPWGSEDILKGSVVSRNGNNIVVSGGVVLRASGNYEFDKSVPVTLASTTSVFREGDTTDHFNIDDISVGQRVTILGEPAGTTGSYAMDASNGTVRMKYSQVSGTIVTTNPLVLNLQYINARRIAVYDFSGTGTGASNDADPGSYEIATGSLPLDSLAINDPVRVRGFPTPFGQAPEDFTADTIINASNISTHIVVGYTLSGSSSAISSIDNTGIQLDLTTAGSVHYLERAGVMIDLTSLGSAPFIASTADNTGLFFISQRGKVNIYTNYDDFESALVSDLGSSMKVRGINVRGDYDATTNTVQANRIGVRLISNLLQAGSS